MSVPNFQHVVQQVRDAQVWDFSTKAGLCAYGNAVVVALHGVDPNFGHLVKFAGQNHCVDPDGRLCAVDVTLYKATGQIVDFILSAGVGSPNEVVWGVGPEGEYGPERWFAPVPSGPTPPGPPPPDPLEPRVVALELELTEILNQIGILNRQLADLDAAVVRKPLPDYTGRLFGFSITSRPKG